MNEDNEQPDPQDFIRQIFGGPSKSEVDKQRMALQAESHATYGWFDNASEEDLTRLRLIVGSIIQAANGHSGAAMQAAFWQGYAAAKLEQHYGVCPSCGTNHMNELLDEPGDE